MHRDTSPLQFSVRHNLAPEKGFNVDFQWQSGIGRNVHKVGIYGPSGSGKTTLLQSIAGLNASILYQLQMGSKRYTRCGHPHHPAVYMGSDTPLFDHLTVLDNLRLTASKSHFARRSSVSIDQAVAWCDINDLLHQFPGSLSGGETQRVAFARALVTAKPLLLLDEAFSALDVRRRLHMLSLLNYLCEEYGMSYLMVSHTLSDLAVSCDELLLIEAGRVKQAGELNALLGRAQQASDAGESGWSILHVTDPEPDEQNDLIRWQVQSHQPQADDQTPGVVYQKRQSDGPFKAPGKAHRLLIDASAVSLSLRPLSDTSFVNQMPATIKAIRAQDNGCLVDVNAFGQTLRAFISSASCRNLALQQKQSVWLIFKALP